MQHLAVIMDGNRRWARKNSVSLAAGYKEGGIRSLQEVMRFCLDHHITYLSLYAFSIENAQRPSEEKEVLFQALVYYATHQKETLIKESISVRFVGQIELLPQNVSDACKNLQQATAGGTRLHISLLLYYGGQQEIHQAVHKTLLASFNVYLSEEEIKKKFESYLWTYPYPAPDMIVRTGGVQRLSNFLLYQSAYAELYFLNKLWPEVSYQDCQNIYDAFQATQRNFGR